MRSSLDLPDQIHLVDVGLRDGLQSLPLSLPTAAKLRIVEGLLTAGVRDLEVVSFARPDVIPQLADAEQLCALLPRDRGTTYRGLIPNLRGAQRAAGCDLDMWVVVVSADDEVSRRNQGRSLAQMLDELEAIGELARAQRVDLVVAVACAFFAPGQGRTDADLRHSVLAAAVRAGAVGVYLAGTTGVEHPGEIHAGVLEARAAFPALRLGVHLHNRNGFGAANALAALLGGVDWLEAAFGGYGGDPWFPGDPMVLGNYPMEDLVHLCSNLGVATGIDLDAYRRVVALAAELSGTQPNSFVTRGGSRADLERFVWPDSSRWTAR